MIDPKNQQVHVCHAREPVEILEEAAGVSADSVLPGFVLDLTAIW